MQSGAALHPWLCSLVKYVTVSNSDSHDKAGGLDVSLVKPTCGSDDDHIQHIPGLSYRDGTRKWKLYLKSKVMYVQSKDSSTHILRPEILLMNKELVILLLLDIS